MVRQSLYCLAPPRDIRLPSDCAASISLLGEVRSDNSRIAQARRGTRKTFFESDESDLAKLVDFGGINSAAYLSQHDTIKSI
jgi:hypothetical protein